MKPGRDSRFKYAQRYRFQKEFVFHWSKEKGDQIPTFAVIQFEIKKQSINFIEEAGCEEGNLKSSQRGQIKNETLAQKYDFKSKVSINFIEEGNS